MFEIRTREGLDRVHFHQQRSTNFMTMTVIPIQATTTSHKDFRKDRSSTDTSLIPDPKNPKYHRYHHHFLLLLFLSLSR